MQITSVSGDSSDAMEAGTLSRTEATAGTACIGTPESPRGI
jgi:hypothetical protein